MDETLLTLLALTGATLATLAHAAIKDRSALPGIARLFTALGALALPAATLAYWQERDLPLAVPLALAAAGGALTMLLAGLAAARLASMAEEARRQAQALLEAMNATRALLAEAALRADLAPTLARLRETAEEEVATAAFRAILEARRTGQPISEAYALERATRDVAYHRQRAGLARHG